MQLSFNIGEMKEQNEIGRNRATSDANLKREVRASGG